MNPYMDPRMLMAAAGLGMVANKGRLSGAARGVDAYQSNLTKQMEAAHKQEQFMRDRAAFDMNQQLGNMQLQQNQTAIQQAQKQQQIANQIRAQYPNDPLIQADPVAGLKHRATMDQSANKLLQQMQMQLMLSNHDFMRQMAYDQGGPQAVRQYMTQMPGVAPAAQGQQPQAAPAAPQAPKPVVPFPDAVPRPNAAPSANAAGNQPQSAGNELIDPDKMEQINQLTMQQPYKDRASFRAKLIDAAIKNKPGEDTMANAKASLQSNVERMADVYRELNELGGVINRDKSTATNLGRYVMTRGPLQEVQKAVGAKAQSLRNEIEKMRPVLINQIRQATGMSAKAMDSNKELQFYLQATTDPKEDIHSNMAALKLLSDMYGLGVGNFDVPKEYIDDLRKRGGGGLDLSGENEALLNKYLNMEPQ